AAGLLARCVPLAERDPALPAETREALTKAYGDQAMALLRQGLRHGPGSDRWKADPHLAPLRPRADFQKLVRDLEESAPSGEKWPQGKVFGAAPAGPRCAEQFRRRP